MTSRANLTRHAVRPAMNARLLLSGPAGSGKTRTGLIVAGVLAEGGTIAVVDTEEESALTYADDFAFEHLAWDPPYDPRELAETIKELGQQHRVILIDSASHFWRGTLEISDGKFGGWKVARPAHEDFVKAILRSPAHVIVCARAKHDYEVTEVQENGYRKQKVEKHGLAPIQDSEFEYELNVSAEINMEHQVSVAKTRCSRLAGRTFQPGHAAELAEVYLDWLKGGRPVADRAVVDALVERMNQIGDPDQRRTCKQAFVATFGKPEFLAVDQVDEATAHVAGYETPAAVTAEQPPLSAVPDEKPFDKEKARKKLWVEAKKIDGLTDDRRKALMANATGGKVGSFSACRDDHDVNRIVDALRDYAAGKYVFVADENGAESLQLAGKAAS